ncbi:AsnC family transcriptional regulator, partial [Pseudomonas sp. NDM]
MPDTRPPTLDAIDPQQDAAPTINAQESLDMLARQLGICRHTVTSGPGRVEKRQVITGDGVGPRQRGVEGGVQG